MDSIEFKVKFITPLLIGGADSKKLDEIGLTGKALRGCWRFWFRAITGGLLEGVPSGQLSALLSVLEECIFGSTQKAKFRLLIEPVFVQTGKYETLPHKTFDSSKDGYSPGSTFKVIIIPRVKLGSEKMMSSDEKEVLLAAIWLWGNLGAVGNRARRGFGSPLICPGTVPQGVFVETGLPVLSKNAFETKEALNGHLVSGLTKVWNIIDKWINSKELKDHINKNCTDIARNTYNSWCSARKNTSPAPDIQKNPKPSGQSKADYFILKSLDQVAVCDTNFSSLYLSTDKNPTASKGAINAVHGKSNCPELGWARPAGNPRRWASPVFIRFHKVLENKKEVFCPVMTWCEQKEIPASTPSCARDFLNGIGFNNSLKGNPV